MSWRSNSRNEKKVGRPVMVVIVPIREVIWSTLRSSLIVRGVVVSPCLLVGRKEILRGLRNVVLEALLAATVLVLTVKNF